MARLLLALALAFPIAQAGAQSPRGSVEACVPIENAADRLACYDKALGRTAKGTREADIEAEEAKAIRENLELGDQIEAPADATQPALHQRVQRAVGDLYRNDDPLAAAVANAGKGSMLDSRWELAKDSKLGTFNFRAYKPVYLLPAFWSSAPNELPRSSNPAVAANAQSLDDVEAKFQLSFKTKAVENLFGDNGDVWMGYTQSSRWQVFNAEASRPFRETNYEPEILLAFRTNYRLGGWSGRLFGIGLNHQSNGRADPLSRSWNRVMLNIGLDREDWALTLRPWWRIPDGEHEDENPGIEDYIGRGDLVLVHRRGRNEFALAARHSLRGGDASRGAVQFDWGFPITDVLRGHVQVFDGYGESLIDYDHRATYIGLGVSLLEWY